MSRLEILRDSFEGSFRNGRLWLVQFFANPILFALFAAWLLIPVASNLHLVYNFVSVFLLVVAALVLHAGTLNLFADRRRSQLAALWPAFRRALRHLIAVALCVAVFCLLWVLVNKLEVYQGNFPTYVRSTFPVSVRHHITLPALDTLFAVVLFIFRWILAPGLLLPFLLQAADRGFRGFGRQGLSAWARTIFSFSYWLVLVFAALFGVLATQKIITWTPDFRTSTFHSEAISLAWRLSVSYLLGLSSWMLVSSVVGRCAVVADTPSDISGNPAA